MHDNKSDLNLNLIKVKRENIAGCVYAYNLCWLYQVLRVTTDIIRDIFI